jgi:hypothetical protein
LYTYKLFLAVVAKLVPKNTPYPLRNFPALLQNKYNELKKKERDALSPPTHLERGLNDCDTLLPKCEGAHSVWKMIFNTCLGL